jgi:site-specific DNA-methyltransferase (adenine-specific)
MAHAAGNSNGKTLRKFPVVTEVCVQYTKRVEFPSPHGAICMRDWLRREWERSGLPLYLTNKACGVKNAATRKYFTKDHLWYYPPPHAFEKIAAYCNEHGDRDGRPYFSIDGIQPLTSSQWAKMRAKFNFRNGVTNVWSVPAVRNSERVRANDAVVHTNQKPLSLMTLCVQSSTDENDVVWEPFGGLCTAALACLQTGRRCFAAEKAESFYNAAVARLERSHDF